MPADRQSPFHHITIIGVGLIGGSLALALKQRFPGIHITGVDRPAVLRRALKRNIVDVGKRSVEAGVQFADLIIIATPVSSIMQILPRVAKRCPPHAIISDTGSVKLAIAEKAAKLFPHGNFIGGHPMAGSEFSGIDAAHPLLFQNAIYILTPSHTTTKQTLRLLANFFASLEARVFTIDPAMHDSVVAAVSHLPQVAAVGLMNTVGKLHPHAPTHLGLAAGGFRDMTRIASSPFEMWKDILSANRKEISGALRLYIMQLQKMKSALDGGSAKLANEFQTSRKLRLRIPKSMKGFLSPLVELSVFIEDKPGELARLTAALAAAAINIKDMELVKVREGRGGTFRLSFENRTVAAEASKILQRIGFDIGGTR